MSDSETKFTPGPWLIEPDTKRIWIKPASGSLRTGGDDVAEIDDDDRDGEEAIANAHLIAAAPDLYEVCDVMATECSFFEKENLPWSVSRSLIEQLHRAIARAKGIAK